MELGGGRVFRFWVWLWGFCCCLLGCDGAGVTRGVQGLGKGWGYLLVLDLLCCEWNGA